VYEGRCTLHDEALLTQLLQAAHFLVLPTLVQSACAALELRVAPDNAVAAWALGDMLKLPSLEQTARQAALRGFSAFASDESFTELPHARLCSLLQDDALQVDDESVVFEAVVRWVRGFGAPRWEPTPEAAAALLAHVRFPLLAASFLQERVMVEPLMQQDACSAVFDQAQSQQAQQRKSSQCLYLLGGRAAGRQSCSVECFDGRQWRAAPPMRTARSDPCAAVLDGSIYVMGGRDDDDRALAAVECFRDGRWQPAPSMNIARYGACAATLDGSIYVIGGITMGYDRTSSVERFRDDKWELGPSLKTARTRACAAALDGAIYVIGGQGSEGNALSSVECFRDDRWQAAPPLVEPRSNACAAVLDGAIYVVGGGNCLGERRGNSSVDCFRDGKWHRMAHELLICEGSTMSHACFCASGCAATLHGVLYFASMRSLRRFCDEDESWQDGPALLSSRSFAAVVVA
jgi:hypothetical protein